MGTVFFSHREERHVPAPSQNHASRLWKIQAFAHHHLHPWPLLCTDPSLHQTNVVWSGSSGEWPRVFTISSSYWEDTSKIREGKRISPFRIPVNKRLVLSSYNMYISLAGSRLGASSHPPCHQFKRSLWTLYLTCTIWTIVFWNPNGVPLFSCCLTVLAMTYEGSEKIWIYVRRYFLLPFSLIYVVLFHIFSAITTPPLSCLLPYKYGRWNSELTGAV